MKVRWKKGKYPGEIEATIGGKKYKIEKALDHNDRHKGEWKVMVMDKRGWEWETTEYGKAAAKSWIYNKHGIKEDAMTTADAGIPVDTKDMGPRLKMVNMTDRRRRKDKLPVLLKRFRKYMEDNG